MGSCCEYYKNDVNDTCSKICNNKLMFIEDITHILNDPKYNTDNNNNKSNSNINDQIIIVNPLDNQKTKDI